MAPTTNARQIFNEIPTGWSSSQLGSGQLSDATQTGYPIPGRTVVYDTAQSIDLENVPLRGGILLKTLVLSIDPYLRGRMRDPAIKSYSASYC